MISASTKIQLLKNRISRLENEIHKRQIEIDNCKEQLERLDNRINSEVKV